MNTSNFMTNSEKLTAYLDSELEPIEAENMFFDVAASPELQEEMRRQLIISKSMKNSLLVPPVALKENILVNIGLASSVPESVIVPTATFFSRMLNSKAVMILSTAIITGVATVLFMLNYNQSDTSLQSKLNDKVVPSTSLSAASIPVTSSEAVVDNKQNLATSRRIPADNSKFAVKRNNENRNVPVVQALVNAEGQPVEDISDLFHYDVSESPIFGNDNNIKLRSSNSSRYLDGVSMGSALADFLNKVSLQLRFTGAKSFTDINIEPINEPLLNDFALAVMYDLASNHSVGFELGQENFLQEYNGMENEIPVTWQQNYIAFWAGLAYQYSMNEYSALQPYGRVFVGGTRVGPLTKATIGAKFNITSKMSTIIGIENTGLFYEYQKKWFSSYKSGITAGISIKF